MYFKTLDRSMSLLQFPSRFDPFLFVFFNLWIIRFKVSSKCKWAFKVRKFRTVWFYICSSSIVSRGQRKLLMALCFSDMLISSSSSCHETDVGKAIQKPFAFPQLHFFLVNFTPIRFEWVLLRFGSWPICQLFIHHRHFHFRGMNSFSQGSCTNWVSQPQLPNGLYNKYFKEKKIITSEKQFKSFVEGRWKIHFGSSILNKTLNEHPITKLWAFFE